MAFFISFLIALVVAIAFFAIFYFLIAKAATARAARPRSTRDMFTFRALAGAWCAAMPPTGV